tara:strand:+ start:6254 stop:6568 length:315 start_codon:yes stop_codon:yes gene_type:complete
MIEGLIILIQFGCIAIAILYIRNLLLTVKNIQTMIQEVADVADEYDKFVTELNSKTTYYGDPTIEELVTLSNQLKASLQAVRDIEKQLFGIEEDHDSEEEEEEN